jgi:LPS-assembly lipoprotein
VTGDTGAAVDGVPGRRALLCALALALSAAGLGGCGFTPRRPAALSFQRLQLQGLDARSPMGRQLRLQLLEAGVQVVETPLAAEVVLHTLTDRRERIVAASTSAGQVRELTLRARYRFRLATPDGRELQPPAELQSQRTLTYNETQALAKAQEEAELFAALEADLAHQVLRRLASVSLAPAPR